jgi:hypothetical protein
MYHGHGNRFGHTLLCMYVKWKLVLVRLAIVLVSAQDRCTVCTECTTGMEIVLGTLDGTPMYVCQVEACFGPFGDSVSLGAR